MYETFPIPIDIGILNFLGQPDLIQTAERADSNGDIREYFLYYVKSDDQEHRFAGFCRSKHFISTCSKSGYKVFFPEWKDFVNFAKNKNF